MVTDLNAQVTISCPVVNLIKMKSERERKNWLVISNCIQKVIARIFL